MALHGGNMWELLMRTAGPYVVAISWKDRSWQQNVGLKGEGGSSPPVGGRGGGGRGSGPPRPPGGDTFAGGGRWSSPQVPMGTGLVDIGRYATVMRDIGFDGPMELQAEYPNGGSESGSDKLTLPRAEVLGNLKRDVLVSRAGLQQSGTGLTI
jgi:hypothetical protein